MANELLALLGLISVLLWAYIIGRFIFEKVVPLFRKPGRPSMRFNFYALIFSLLVVYFLGGLLDTKLSTAITRTGQDPFVVYLVLIVLAFSVVKKYRLID